MVEGGMAGVRHFSGVVPLSLEAFQDPMPTGVLPPYKYGIDPVVDIIRSGAPVLGIDLEFTGGNTGPGDGVQIEVLGIASCTESAACPWDPGALIPELERYLAGGGVLSAYAGIRTDFAILHRAGLRGLGMDSTSDGMLWFWLVHAHLCKAPGKEEDDEGGSLGFMNLWTAASLLLDTSQWKVCRGVYCKGPCPVHDKAHYCAVDAWAGLLVDLESRAIARSIDINEDRYRDRARIEYLMTSTVERHGLAISHEQARNVEGLIKGRKNAIEGLFPCLNFMSSVQVKKALARAGVLVKTTTRDALEDVLRRLAPRAGYVSIDDAREYVHTMVSTGARPAPNDPVPLLAALVEHKWAGKGTKSWFKSARPGPDGLAFVYPRIISTGTSTGRLSSSRPNFQNVASRGWGELVRRVIVPRRSDLIIVEADYSQLELRMMLYLAGRDVSSIEGDAFNWLVAQSNGRFEAAAERLRLPARHLAKTTSHAANYLEGLVFLNPRGTAVKRSEANGSLRIYRDWPAPKGTAVAFNGANLAKRLFGDTSELSRAEALRIQEDVYFGAFGDIRRFHREIISQVVLCPPDGGYVKGPTGRAFYIYPSWDYAGTCKALAAFYGQGLSADFVVDRILALYERHRDLIDGGEVYVLPPVHDSVAFEVPRAWGDDRIMEFLSDLWSVSRVLPGFRCPMKVKKGENYGDLREI